MIAALVPAQPQLYRAFGGLGVSELLIILVIVVLIFGAGKLPQVGGALGKSIREFKKAQSGEGEVVDVTPEGEAAPKAVEAKPAAAASTVEQPSSEHVEV